MASTLGWRVSAYSDECIGRNPALRIPRSEASSWKDAISVNQAAIAQTGDLASFGSIGLGAMGLTGTYGPVARRDARAVVDAAIAAGIRHVDTAASYGDGENERLIGAALARRREVLIATKCGVRWAGGRLLRDGSPTAIRRGIEESLARLGRDRIDLLYLHRVDPGTPIERSVEEMLRASERGLVARIGLSEASATTIERAAHVAPICALQSEYSLMSRGLESEIMPLLDRLGISLVAYAPLGRGLLGDDRLGSEPLARGDFRRVVPRFSGEHLARNLQRAGALNDIAAERGLTPAQVALAWTIARAGVIAIPGTSRPDAVRENAAAAAIRLSPVEMATLARHFPRGAASGERYPRAMSEGLEP